jgi:hypothetical protein
VRTDRLVLIASPVGGSELATLLDPLGLTIGRDLRVDRRARAEAIASIVPTLIIVGNLLGPHDGVVSHEAARVPNTRFILAPSANHATLRNSPWVTRLVRAFFAQPSPPETDLAGLVARIAAVPGIRPAHPHLRRLAQIHLMLADGTTIRLLGAIPGLELVFVATGEGACIYAGAVPSSSRAALHRALDEIRQECRAALLEG